MQNRDLKQPYNPDIPLLDIYLKESATIIPTAKKRLLPFNRWRTKTAYIHMKKNEITSSPGQGCKWSLQHTKARSQMQTRSDVFFHTENGSSKVSKGVFESRRGKNGKWRKKGEKRKRRQLGNKDLSRAVCDYGKVTETIFNLTVAKSHYLET